MDDLKDLRQRLHKLSSEELLQIVRIDFADYRTNVLDLTREELQRRGYSESEIQASHVQAAKKRNMPIDPQLATISFLLVTAVTAVITFSLFAPIVYYSVVAYG